MWTKRIMQWPNKVYRAYLRYQQDLYQVRAQQSFLALHQLDDTTDPRSYMDLADKHATAWQENLDRAEGYRQKLEDCD